MTGRPVCIIPEAEAELQAAAEWYEQQRAGLGLELLQEAARAYERVTAGEHGSSISAGSPAARRTPVERFPFWIVFLELDTEIVVVAFVHERRRPGYWVARLKTT